MSENIWKIKEIRSQFPSFVCNLNPSSARTTAYGMDMLEPQQREKLLKDEEIGNHHNERLLGILETRGKRGFECLLEILEAQQRRDWANELRALASLPEESASAATPHNNARLCLKGGRMPMDTSATRTALPSQPTEVHAVAREPVVQQDHLSDLDGEIERMETEVGRKKKIRRQRQQNQAEPEIQRNPSEVEKENLVQPFSEKMQVTSLWCWTEEQGKRLHPGDEPANRSTAVDVSAGLVDVQKHQAALVMAVKAEQRRRHAEQEQQQQQNDGHASGGAAATAADAQPLVIERLENDIRALQATGTVLAAEKCQLQQANDQLAALNGQLQTEVERVTAEKHQIQAAANQLRAERDQFSHRKRLVDEECDQLSNWKRLVEEERDQLSNQKCLVDQECDKLSKENQRLKTVAQQHRKERDDLKAESRKLVTEADPRRVNKVPLTDNGCRLTNANGDSLKVLLETGSRADGIPGMVARCQRLFRKPRGELPHIELPPKWQVAGRLPECSGYSSRSVSIHNGYLYIFVQLGDQPNRGHCAVRIQLNRLEAGNWENVYIPGEPFWTGGRFFVYGETLYALCLSDAAEGPHHMLKLCDGEWKHVIDLPEKKWRACCCLHGSHLFVTGGITSPPSSPGLFSDCSRSVHSYDLAAVAGTAWVHWPAVPSIPLHAIPIITTSKQLRLMGCQPDPVPVGCEGISQIWSLDLQTSPANAKWCRQLPDIPASKSCAAVINEEVVIVGGRHMSLKRAALSSNNVWDHQPPLRDVHMLDKDRSQWLPLPCLNHAKYGSNVILYEESIYSIGGHEEKEIEVLHL